MGIVSDDYPVSACAILPTYLLKLLCKSVRGPTTGRSRAVSHGEGRRAKLSRVQDPRCGHWTNPDWSCRVMALGQLCNGLPRLYRNVASVHGLGSGSRELSELAPLGPRVSGTPSCTRAYTGQHWRTWSSESGEPSGHARIAAGSPLKRGELGGRFCFCRGTCRRRRSAPWSWPPRAAAVTSRCYARQVTAEPSPGRRWQVLTFRVVVSCEPARPTLAFRLGRVSLSG
jgi:hypothetical protein